MQFSLYRFFSLLLLFTAIQIQAEALNEPGAGMIEFLTPDNQNQQHQALHLHSEAKINISGMVANVKLVQSFKNDSQVWQEGRYVFPLPEAAAVTAMEIQIGERLIKGTIKEKQAAQKIYREAKTAGKKAGLLQQHRPNLFSQSIANIGPGEQIDVRLSYVQAIDYQQGEFKLHFPMTLTPRYIPGVKMAQNDEIDSTVTIDQSGWGWSAATDAVKDAHLITPPQITNPSEGLINPIRLTIRLDAGLPLASIDSHYHPISIQRQQGQHLIELAAGEVSMDRDFSLSWQPVPQSQPSAALFTETMGNDDYAMLMLMPPQVKQQNDFNREVLFVIDTSGSMGGMSIRQAKAALLLAIKQLQPQDRFNIIEFNSQHSLLFSEPRAANPRQIQQALSFVDGLQASGGTEILPALDAALTQNKSDGYLRQIIFITDGSVGNEAQIFQHLHQNLGSSRLFTVGIGSAPNRFFMRKAATIGRGSFTTIGKLDEVTQEINRLLHKIQQPVMRDISIVDSHGQPLEIFPHPLPDLYAGEPLVALIRKDYEAEQIMIKGMQQQQPWEKIMNAGVGKSHPGIIKLWARQKIEHLLDQKITGVDETTIRQQVLEVALRHQLMSPYTSFIAIEEVVSRPTEQALNKTAVANAIPAGQTLQAVNYPQTATPLWLNIVIGLLASIGLFFLSPPNKKRFINGV